MEIIKNEKIFLYTLKKDGTIKKEEIKEPPEEEDQEQLYFDLLCRLYNHEEFKEIPGKYKESDGFSFKDIIKINNISYKEIITEYTFEDNEGDGVWFI